MNTLLVDIGNSRLKWGVHRDALLRETGAIELHAIAAQGISVLPQQWPRAVDAVVICNVAGDAIGDRLAVGVRSRYGVEPQFVQAERSACGVTNSYTEPHRLGVDRWVAMIGARAACAKACVVVDAGTAITIDALDDAGNHLGGQIMPGLQLMLAALASGTSKLPPVRARAAGDRDGVLANNSAAAMTEGVRGAAAGAVERVLRAMRRDAKDPVLFLTGGDADSLYRSLGEMAELRPNLVLEGLACLAGGALRENHGT